MNRLQLYLTMSDDGFHVKTKINEDSDILSWVTDITDAVALVGYRQSKLNVFYLLKYIETGYFIIAVRTVQDAGDCHVAAWLYVPYALDVPDERVKELLNFIVEKISGTAVSNSDIRALTQELEREYPEIDDAPVFPPSDGATFAHRFYGAGTGLTLANLIGRYKFQVPYLQYDAVLLVDESVTDDVKGDDLSRIPTEQMATLLPPDVADTDYRPSIFGCPFDRPYFVPRDKEVTVIWSSDTAPDIIQHITINQPEMRSPNIDDENTQMNEDTNFNSKENEFEANNANDFNGNNNAYDSQEERAQVYMPDSKQRKNVYRFRIPSRVSSIGSTIDFEVETTIDLHESPIEGYETSSDIHEGANKVNNLFYVADNPKRKLMNNIIWGVGGLLVGILLMLVTRCGSGSDKTSSAPAAGTPTETTEQTDATTQSAGNATAEAPAALSGNGQEIAYLDSKTKWNKDEMEQYVELQGLFDDMNNFEIERIAHFWGPKLKASKNFSDVAKHAQQSLDKKLTPKQKIGRNTYNQKADDKVITLVGYKNAIDYSKK